MWCITLPAEIRDIAYQNKAVIYDLLFKASAETTLKIAATPRHLGARIGFMSVLHTWGSALTHPAADEPRMLPRPCPCCGGRMFIIETFARGCEPKHRPTPVPARMARIDTS